jgi:hypothetical protein
MTRQYSLRQFGSWFFGIEVIDIDAYERKETKQ